MSLESYNPEEQQQNEISNDLFNREDQQYQELPFSDVEDHKKYVNLPTEEGSFKIDENLFTKRQSKQTTQAKYIQKEGVSKKIAKKISKKIAKKISKKIAKKFPDQLGTHLRKYFQKILKQGLIPPKEARYLRKFINKDKNKSQRNYNIRDIRRLCSIYLLNRKLVYNYLKIKFFLDLTMSSRIVDPTVYFDQIDWYLRMVKLPRKMRCNLPSS